MDDKFVLEHISGTQIIIDDKGNIRIHIKKCDDEQSE